MTMPLERFRVIELTLARAGPAAGRHLADWGADVIRVEAPLDLQPGEDFVGKRSGFDQQNLHRNKRSLSLNLRTEEGRHIFMDLAATSDVIIENMRSSVKHRLGIDYESVRKINPKIVYGSISGFGQSGPYAERPGVDQIVQGMGGLMSVTGFPDREPVRSGVAILDVCAGAYLAQAVLIALLEREKTGLGRWVQTSLMESAIAMLDFQGARYLVAGEVAGRTGNDHPTACPSGVFPCSDGDVSIGAAGDRLFKRFCSVIERPDLAARPEYATGRLRSTNREHLNKEISDITKLQSMQYWDDLLSNAGVPCGPIYTIDKVFADPQVVHLGMALPLNTDVEARPIYIGQPYSMQGVAMTIKSKMADLGADNDEILGELGYGDDKITALRNDKVI